MADVVQFPSAAATDAERREGYLKTTAGRKGLKLILRHTLASRVWD